MADLEMDTITDYQVIPTATFEFKVGQNSNVTIKDLPLLSNYVHYHVMQQETCLGTHGFYDMEEQTCTTVHRLQKVCLQVKFDEEAE